MSQSFSYSVGTRLKTDAVWQLFVNVKMWSHISHVYDDLAWVGDPWLVGSSITGRLIYPVAMPFRYLIRDVKHLSLIRYLAHSAEIGFATERTITFEQLKGSTLIRVGAYAVGTCNCTISGGTRGFLKAITENWFLDFARVCDDEASLHEVPKHGVPSFLPERFEQIWRRL